MTRVNCISPDRLTDQHLLAEYRELPRAFSFARPGVTVPSSYRMGAGHVLFFASRTGFLARRQRALIEECLRRGFAISFRTAPDPVPGFDDDWSPTAADVEVNLARLRQKIREKPGWYRYCGEIVNNAFYSGVK